MVCNICLEVLQDPVITPCGHVFCLECLISCSWKSLDATKAPCPTCRTLFSLVSPDPAFIPEKYRCFMDSNIRKVYLDNSAEADLQDKVAQLEARVQSLEKDKSLLMERCESHMAGAICHAQRERDARLQCATLQKELKQANLSFAQLLAREAQRSSVSASTPPTRHSLSLSCHSELATTATQTRPVPMAQKRRPGTNALSESSPPQPAAAQELRSTVPLPKRRRVSRSSVPDGA